ncbi:hypothetical protein K437DRAFT_99551 [Tilletiaria anomala UBC 951]|uniref:protein kinase C n=1 Tax=Tilletiaria anomala (strain ATCC 24038 / CBS 436.72 / UBC 951) TaxID=1037660 RepID=A0A066W064_TILAU|nr:uncharacterized protein K437DRAFT_99551 [Tilletiaria anomala UBC 951]KDN47332.1 hypothetical protein K437DRAFT_99551 [Tilletiaria anomala UBC 951]
MADTQAKIADIMARIQTERRTMEGYQQFRRATANADVVRRAESGIRESQKRIAYYEDSLMQLHNKQQQAQRASANTSSSPGVHSFTITNQPVYDGAMTTSGGSSCSGGGAGGMAGSYPGDSSASYTSNSSSASFDGPRRHHTGLGCGSASDLGSKTLPPPPLPSGNRETFGLGGAQGTRAQSPEVMGGVGAGGHQQTGYGGQQPPPGIYGGYANANPTGMRQMGTYGQQPDGLGQRNQGMPVGRAGTTYGKKNYTNLDLIKYDTPLTTAKISRMLQILEFKLQTEKQYENAVDKMAKLYQAEGDRKSKADAESKRMESNSKIGLLQKSLKKYKQLHIMDDEDDDESAPGGSAANRRENLRKPLTGTLQISLRGARDIDHAPIRGSRATRESTVVVKVEDTPRAKTHPSRTDRWQEDFEIAVDNANEMEVTIYDRVSGNPAVPVGMVWIRISDIVDELRKKKFGQVPDATGAPQHAAMGGMPGAPPGWVPADHTVPGSTPMPALQDPAGQPVPNGPIGDGVEAWFAVEPAGAIQLRVNFIKQNVRKMPYDARLGRQGAVRKRKEDVTEISGHKFVNTQFYSIIRCALCGEFLLNAQGSQCEDCRYACHKKCAIKVFTKCISKSNAESERDEKKLNHRIPHRFEPITNISANWCCHCGYILPLGRKNARKCSECDVTCHTDCAHLVPDLCQMSMEVANQLLQDIDSINRMKKTAQQQREQREQLQAQAPTHSHGQQPPGAFGVPPPGAPGQGQFGQHDSQMQGIENQAAQMSLGNQYGQQIPPQQQQMPPSQGGRMPGSSQFDPYARPDGVAGPPRPLPSQPQVSLPSSVQETRRPSPSPSQHSFASQPSMHQQYASSSSSSSTRIQQQQPLPGQYGTPQSQEMPPQMGGPGYGHPILPQPMQQQQQPMAPQQQQQQPYLPQGQMIPPPQQQQQAPVKMGQDLSQGSQMVPAAGRQQAAMTAAPKRSIGLNDFNFLAVLGKGNFGKVMLAEEIRTGSLYAIKVLKKEFIIENDEVESTKSEKRVFLAAARERHPFLIGLHSCFQTETRIYFVMEYVSGGDLMLHIQREQFSRGRAKFYAAEVLLALEYFHKQGIIYRDLKLDNILLTLDGHIKIADYGLCKEEMWYGCTTGTFCGTPEFMAPEILLEQRYGRAVDWWAFGILIYEMLLGQAPFRGDDEDEIFDAILEDEPLFPLQMPQYSVPLLTQLLQRDPNKRLGSGPNDAEEIKAHPYFRDVNWDDIFHKRNQPPFLPTIKNAADTSWFDTEFTSEKPTLTPVHSVLSPQDQAEFKDFSWTAPHIQ